MDTFGMSDLRQLTEAKEGPCVTICMPTHVAAGAEGLERRPQADGSDERADQQVGVVDRGRLDLPGNAFDHGAAVADVRP